MYIRLSKYRYLKGAMFLSLYALFSSLNDVVMKFSMQFTQTSTVDMLFLRHAFANIFLLPFIIRKRPKIMIRNVRNHLLRAIMFGLAMLCYISALKNLPLATVVAINFSIPLWVVLFAHLFLHEKLKQRLLSVAIGFVGVFIICAPMVTMANASSALTYSVLIMLAATCIFALLDIFNKYLLNQNETITMMLFGSNFFIALLALPFFSFTIPKQILLFVYLGLGANLVLYFLLRAWKSCDISALQPIKYIEFPLALLFGSIVFNDTNGTHVLIGFAIIMISIALNTIYEMRK